MQLYLVRHTQVDMPKGICYGHADVGLAGTFPEEVTSVRSQLQDIVAFDKIYCSPLKRCIMLAQELADDFIIDERIKEYNFGDWERKEWNDIYVSDEGKKWFDDYVNTVCPQGESFRMMLERVELFIHDLPADAENILIVTHAGIVRAFFIILENYTIGKAFDTPVAYGQVIKIKV
ncbi:alpha-ribazole phosphatase [uncultured Proteiniphilum sp.]|uniref:alpha-ribazole phosphatase n=1 Tax=uncultured Proteiniphilum sp. TaxID=497637 RepID=UPI002610EBC1|nr:alpha-ribazole phosphatase [uncultured Proteiniphilum sp.]